MITVPDVLKGNGVRLLERRGLPLEQVRPASTIRPNLGGPPWDTRVFVLARSPR